MQRKWYQLGVALLLVMLLTLPVQAFAAEAEETVSVVETETLPAIQNNAAETKGGATGWIDNADGTRSYQVDGVLLTEGIYLIDGYYYGFDYYGELYVDALFDIWYQNENGDYVYDTYRAKSDGTLCVNQWYENDWGDTEYFGADCKMVDGLVVIDGVQYVFSYHVLLKENTDCIDGVWYYGDKNGVAYVLQNNAWSEADGKYFYVMDGDLCMDDIYLINGKYYGFNYCGELYVDTLFNNWYSDENGDYVYDTYRAKSDGTLFINEWYDNGWGDTEYFGADCKMVDGLVEIDGVLYVFSSQFLLKEETICIDGVWYHGDKNGVAHVLQNNAWSKLDGKYFYVMDGDLCANNVYLIDGNYYGFDYYGVMYCDEAFTFYGGAEGVYHRYRASKTGALYVNQWYTSGYGYKYYYGEGGVAVSGIVEIDGVLHYFDSDGEMQKEDTVIYNGCYYAINSSGEAAALADNAWTKVFGDYYYVMDGELCQNDVYQIGGVYYGFDGNGKMRVNTDFGFYDNKVDDWVYYRADETGALYRNTWYFDEEGEWYYFGEDARGADGILKLGTAYYAFDGGCMYADIHGSVYTLDNNGVYRWCYFYAREDGTLYVNTWMLRNGKYYYYGAKGIAPQGAATVDGVQYYFEDGAMVTNRVVHVKNVPHRADSNGHLTALADNAWTKVEGKYYYVKDGVLCKSGIYEIDGALYAFSTDGDIYCETDFDIVGKDVNGTRREMRGFAGADGKLYVNRWYAVGAYWYYSLADGTAATGMQTIGGKQYYFRYDGKMESNTVVEVGGVTYLVNKSGVAVEAVDDGWFLYGGAYYYFRDGEMLKEGVYKIGGVYYGFNEEGQMYDNEVFSSGLADAEDSEDYRYGYFYAKKGGALYTNSWAQDDESNWYYFDADGLALEGVHTVDGTQYYFDYYGRMVINTMVEFYDGTATCYYADGTGRLYQLNRNGWSKADGYWFYSRNGQICTTEVVEIDGVYYAFDHDGKMYVDVHTYVNGLYYCARPDGSLVRNAWRQTAGGAWRYYGDDCAAVTGLQEINGKLYYFGYYEAAHNCLLRVNGKVYRAGKDMVLVELADGWVINPENGLWYYVKDGEMVFDDILTINGKTYVFRDATLASGVVYSDGACYLADENGCLVTTPGWVSYEGWYYYVQNDYTLYEGWLTLGSKSYYMYPAMACNTVVSLRQNGRPVLYVAGADGSLTRFTGDGFYELDPEERCYIRDGKIVCGEWIEVDGKRYYAFGSGIIARYGTYVVDGKLYLFNEDGVLATSGWYDAGYMTYYIQADDTITTGLVEIDGKRYIFYEEGQLIKDRVYSLDGVVCYVIDKNGVIITQLSGDGWVKVAGEYYYLRNNVPANDELIYENGKYYFVDYTYRMVRDQINGNRYFGADGAAKTGWFKLGGVWHYADAQGNLARGLKEIDGNTYYFAYEGRMMTGQYEIEGKYYSFASNGILTSVSAFPNGWSYADGEAYYYKNGQPYTGWVGDYYIQSGLMARNRMVYDGNAYYYVDAKGTYVKNQFVYDWETGYEMYAKANGMLAENQWIQIGGNWHYFSGLDMIINGSHVIDGKVCLFDNGVYQGVRASNNRADGWVKQNGQWYYSIAGVYLRNVNRYIGGNWYAFDRNGVMITSEFVEHEFFSQYGDYASVYYYYGADGTRASYVGWKMIDGVWVYFNEDHTVHTGWLNDNGKYYYMYGQHGYSTDYVISGSAVYRFGSDGVLIGEVTKQNGWMTIGDITVYFENGKLIETEYYYSACIREIDGKEYVFEGGILLQNVITYVDGAMRYVDENGMLVSKSGWYKFGDAWIYVLSDGVLADGMQLINGVSYCFEDYVLFE